MCIPYTGIQSQHMQFIFFGKKLGNCALECGEIGKIELEKLGAASWLGVEPAQALDGRLGFGIRSSGQIESGIMLVEDLAELEANSSVTALEWIVRNEAL